MHWCVGVYLHKSHSVTAHVFRRTYYRVRLLHSFRNNSFSQVLILYWATVCHFYGFQLPAALFVLVRIFFHAIFFRPKKQREGRRSRAEECASHSLSRSHSLSSILSLPSRQYGDCSFLATLILRDRNFYLESDSTEEQPFLHDI